MSISVPPPMHARAHTHTHTHTSPSLIAALMFKIGCIIPVFFFPHNVMSFTEFMVTSKKAWKCCDALSCNNKPVSLSQIKVKELCRKSELTFCKQLFSYFELHIRFQCCGIFHRTFYWTVVYMRVTGVMVKEFSIFTREFWLVHRVNSDDYREHSLTRVTLLLICFVFCFLVGNKLVHVIQVNPLP
jgi:hypothetical protein